MFESAKCYRLFHDKPTGEIRVFILSLMLTCRESDTGFKVSVIYCTCVSTTASQGWIYEDLLREDESTVLRL